MPNIRKSFLLFYILMCSFFIVVLNAYAGSLITVKGSDTMVIVAQRWAEEYMKAHPNVTIQVTGGGSGTGLAALINGTTDLADASRPIKKKEINTALKKGHKPKEYKVAMDALAVVVNKDNPVSSLSIRQLMGIYMGAINNWKELGGNDMPIMRYSRESNSGTYLFFKEHVLKNQDYASDCQHIAGTAAVADAVAKDEKGIGYGGIAYFLERPKIKILGISRTEGEKAQDPINRSNNSNLSICYKKIWNAEYPLARYLFIYTIREAAPIERYIEWILGKEGQEIVMELGYVPLNKEVVGLLSK